MDVVQQQIRATDLKRLSTNFNNNPRGLFTSGAYGNPAAYFKSINTGRSDLQPPGISASVLDLDYNFNARDQRPNRFAQAFGEYEDSTNPRINAPLRRYMTFPHTDFEKITTPGRQSLASIMRVRPHEPPGGGRSSFALSLASGGAVQADTYASVAQTPVGTNVVLAMLQRDVADTDWDVYLRTRPIDWWAGVPVRPYGGAPLSPLEEVGMPNYRGLSWDGVVTHELAADGSHTARSEGERFVPRMGGTSHMDNGIGGAGFQKIVTVVRCGRTTIDNYWGRDGVCVGAKLFGILRKFPSTHSAVTTNGPDDVTTRLVYNVAQKGGIADIPLSVELAEAPAPFMPYEWCFWASPNGERPPAWLTNYTDEKGRYRQDAVVAEFGYVQFVPDGTAGSVYAARTVAPLRTLGRIRDHAPLDVTLDCDDGWRHQLYG
jgi:hypothetical protein